MPNDTMARQWVLNLAVEFPTPLWQLYPVVRTQVLNVKEIPGFAPGKYAAVLQELLNDQMVQLSDAEGASPADLGRTLAALAQLPVAPSWEMARMPGGRICFELTPRGGAAWESLAEPDWAHILVESSDLECCDLFSPDRNQLMAHMGWYSDARGQAIDLETVQVSARTDFSILYWKRLPSVYHASFRFKPRSKDGERGKPLYSFSWFKDWAALRWHRDPWDLPSWPE